MNLDWLQMKPTIDAVPSVYDVFRQNLERFLATQQP
jgi:hypothetical protein